MYLCNQFADFELKDNRYACSVIRYTYRVNNI